MQEQQHTKHDHYRIQNAGKVRNWKIVLIITVSVVVLAITIIWIMSSLNIIPSFWATIISIICTILGVVVTFLPLVISAYEAKLSAVSSPVPSPITAQVQIASTQDSLSISTKYRGITGFPPPISAKSIQQRQKEVENIYEQIIQPDITALVLTGIGGLGKSTLAALVYQHTEAQRRSGNGPFVAPTLWLRIDPSVMMLDLAGTLFELMDTPLPNFSSLHPPEQSVRLFTMLNTTNEPRLVILDQFENLLDWQTGYALINRPGIGEWLDLLNSQQCRCRILLTSRPRPKGTREYPSTYMQEYPVGGLTAIEGIDLLQKQGVKGTDAELRQAVVYCNGHTFALTLLASLMKNHNLNLPSLFRNPTYTQLWDGSIARNILDEIYKRQLDQLQRELLCGFSIYREPVLLDAACAVAEIVSAALKTQFALHVLLAQHLLQATGDGNYQLHAIVANYARDQFTKNDEQINHQRAFSVHRHAAIYYVQQAARIDVPKKQRRSVNDIHHFLEAIWQYCQAEQWQEAYDLLKYEDIFSALKRWGGNATLFEICQHLLHSNYWQSESSQYAYIYNNLGDVCWLLGQAEQAKRYYNQTLQICQKITDFAEEGWARNNLGRIYNTMGNTALAQEYLEQALQLFRALNDRSGEGRCIINLGWVYYDRGDMELAQQYFEQALKIFNDEDDRRELGFVYGYLGRVYYDKGDRLLAYDYYEKALEMLGEVADRNGEGTMLCNLGRVCNALQLSEQAQKYLEQALKVFREVGDRSGEATALNDLGKVYADLGENQLAQAYFERALPIRREVGNRRGEARTLTDLGRIYLDLGQIEQAQTYFEQALQVLDVIEDGWRAARTLKNLSKVYLLLGKKLQAFRSYKKALYIYERIGNRWEEGTILFELGLLYLAQNQYAIALSFFMYVQAVDEEVKDFYTSEIQKHLAVISSKMSKEDFTALLAIVTPQVEQMVKEALANL